ncbi:glycosyltransferase family 1 protein [Aspergillus clavatus NRRL 1]|uniref:UDP-glucoronosyl and UDP-glucosyl transferase, putative n=1 Tax=Aspergillus clavatus (strain ATCC 1007 / CBS 513.65 / DSM 816 / NCTC 3887 / NRRL 1 / QM 1276 / 107) TaxID=344612 RepID=A1C6K1_ASPCL|nr:UDP-glucoronosyl and UDP-glucosyl transferase, putative [Aspergillus clavatus NRRL 1]EAW14022.1 UDP-glucoronosyl and UDP-glucosyl transferase, putative [Aspergillus clavatus NRRL 1]
MNKRTILFLTNSELGQASVILAVAHEFLLRPEYDVHIGSFPALSPSIQSLNTQAQASTQHIATFHPLSGQAMKDAYTDKLGGADTFAVHDIGWKGALHAYRSVLVHAMAPWSGREYMALCLECLHVVRDLQPAAVVVDPLFAPALDACRVAGCAYIVLSPNTVKDHVVQPGLANLWQFPALCSGYPYPVPVSLVIPNTLLCLSLGWLMYRSPELRALTNYRNTHGVEGPLPSMIVQPGDETRLLIPSRPEYEFPAYVPENVTMCGPILRPWSALSQDEDENHAELAEWMAKRPTILANLGSHVTFDNEMARQFAEGLSHLLKHVPQIHVLWKLKWKPQIIVDDRVFQSIRGAITDGRVRITDWIQAEPISLLMSGHVQCVVHHGGSNSFHEAIRAGVPQIILPVWFDTYDFANRVEWLGIGIWASRQSAPAINGEHLGRALVRVLASGDSATFEAKARSIAAHLGSKEGRVVACEKIIEVIDAGERASQD